MSEPDNPTWHNQSPAQDPRRRTYFSWEEFDRLPRLIRDLMNYTPVSVGTGYVWAQLMAGSAIEAVARAAHKRWSNYGRAQMLALYGPTHPQFAEYHAE